MSDTPDQPTAILPSGLPPEDDDFADHPADPATYLPPFGRPVPDDAED